MALILNEEQGMLRDSAAAFLSENASLAQLRALRDETDGEGFSRPLWNNFNEMGFTGVLIPEAHGGLGLGHVEAGAMMEQMGHNLSASPFLASSVLAVMALRLAGSKAQQEAWLPKLATGAAIGALAVDESSKHRPDRIAFKAVKQAQGWQLDGSKTFVLTGNAADVLIVAARTSDKRLSLFLVPSKTPGLSAETVNTLDSHKIARIECKSLVLGDEALLGTQDQGEPVLQSVLDAGRAAAAAEMLGIADEVFTRTTAYLKERKQFGRLIGEFQALQHRAAELYCDIEMTRAAVMKALNALDQDPTTAALSVSIAKAKAGTTVTLAVQEGVQMHGGMGMTDAFDFGFFMKRARVLQELFGDASFHQDRVARLRGY